METVAWRKGAVLHRRLATEQILQSKTGRIALLYLYMKMGCFEG